MIVSVFNHPQLARDLNLPLNHPEAQLILEYSGDVLELRFSGKQRKGIAVDFSQTRAGSGELLKAIGKSKTVLDATGGLARDAAMLASRGIQVTLFERHAVVFTLLQDGLRRAAHLPWIHNLQVLHGNSIDHIPQYQPETIYLDPMYPERKKDALPKLEMQLFHALLGANPDDQELFQTALQHATKRVVVKRPLHAEYLAQHSPNLQFKGKTTRFDVYLKNL